MSKPKVPLKSKFASEIEALIWAGYVLPTLPEDVSDVEAIEHRADDFVQQENFSGALRLYESLGSSVQRVRHKTAWCHYRLGQPEKSAPLLEDAEKASGTVPIALLCYSLEAVDLAQHTFGSVEARDRIVSLLNVALRRPAPFAGIFHLADKYIHGDPERSEHVQAAFQHFPHVARFRQNYLYLAARRKLLDVQSLLDLAMPAARQEGAATDDIWVALHIARMFSRPEEAAVALDLLKARGTVSPKLVLIEADVWLQLGRVDHAWRLFSQVRQQVESRDGVDAMRCEAWALRGLIEAAARTGDAGSFAQYAVQLGERYKDGQLPEKWFGLFDADSSLLYDYHIAIEIGDDNVYAEPLTHLKEFRELLLADDIPIEIRGIYRAAFASYDWSSADGPEDELNNHERSRDAVLHQVDTIVAETRHPSAAGVVAQLQLELKRYDDAGFSFAAYCLSYLELFGEGALYVHDPLDDDASVSTVQAFAAGVARCFTDKLAQDPSGLAHHGYEVASTLARQRLLDNKCYPEFAELMRCVEQAARQVGDACLESSAWFDIGLAHHYMKRSEAAVAAYRRCLTLNPEYFPAAKNLDMLLSPEARRREIQIRYIRNLVRQPPPGSLEEMPFSDAVYLLALFRACGGLEQDATLRPFKDSEFPFAPTSQLRQPLFNLLRCGLVHISPDSPPDAFDVNLDKGAVDGLYLHKLSWELPARTIGLIRAVESAAITGKWPKAWREQAPALALDLARGECLEYLEHSARERGFDMPQGEKPRMMFDNLLASYSVAQCYAFIYRGARNAADYRARKSVSRTHASNLMVSSIQRYADTARAEGWDVKPYSRIKDCPRSMLSFVLHDTFLHTGERSFETPIPELSRPEDRLGLSG